MSTYTLYRKLIPKSARDPTYHGDNTHWISIKKLKGENSYTSHVITTHPEDLRAKISELLEYVDQMIKNHEKTINIISKR